MKSGLLLTIAFLCAFTTFGQVKLGAEAGLTLFNTSHTRTEPLHGYEEKIKYQPGLKLGVIAEYTVLKRLSVQTGIAFVSKGFRNVYIDQFHWGPSTRPKFSARIDYLEVPLNVLGGVGKHLRIGAGGYFGYGIGGKAVYRYTVGGSTSDEERELILDNPQTESMVGFRRTDYGLLFSASYTFPLNTIAQVQFSKGLKDIMPDVPFHSKTESFKNWGFIISAGWYFVHF